MYTHWYLQDVAQEFAKHYFSSNTGFAEVQTVKKKKKKKKKKMKLTITVEPYRILSSFAHTLILTSSSPKDCQNDFSSTEAKPRSIYYLWPVSETGYNSWTM